MTIHDSDGIFVFFFPFFFLCEQALAPFAGDIFITCPVGGSGTSLVDEVF
jgi:hypothetical protein